MADNTYDIYNDDGTTTTYSYEPLAENTFNWDDWGGNPADYGGSTNSYTPTDTSIGTDYSGSGGSDASGGAGTYNTNFGFTATAKPASVTDIVQKAAGSFDLGSLASGALDWLMDGTNWQKVLAGAGGLAAFLQANGAEKKTPTESAAEQYKAMYNLLHKPIKVNGQMVDMYGPLEGIKPIDRMRQDATGKFIPPTEPAVAGGLTTDTTKTTTVANGGLIQRYATGGLVQNYKKGGTAAANNLAAIGIGTQNNNPSLAALIAANTRTASPVAATINTGTTGTAGTTTAGTTTAGTGSATTTANTTGAANTGSTTTTTGTTGAANTGALNAMSQDTVVDQIGKDSLPPTFISGKKLTTEQKAANLEALGSFVTSGMTNAQIAKLLSDNGLTAGQLPSGWKTTLQGTRNTLNMDAALTSITGTSTLADVTEVLKQYGSLLPKNAKKDLISDLTTERTTFTTNYEASQNNSTDLLGKITPGMSTDDLNTLIASYGGKLPADIQATASAKLSDINTRSGYLDQYGDSPSSFADVNKLYKTYLGREPTQEEKYYWDSKLLLDGKITLSEVESFVTASQGEKAYSESSATTTGAKSSYTATDVAAAFDRFIANPGSVNSADMLIINAVGGVDQANNIANSLYSGTIKAGTVISTVGTLPTGTTMYTDAVTGLIGYKDANGRITYATNVGASQQITPADAWTLLAKEQSGVDIPAATWAQYGGRDKVIAAARNYTGAHVGDVTVRDMEAYNPGNYPINVKKNADGSYSTTYIDGTVAYGKPSTWLGAVEGETAAVTTNTGGGGSTTTNTDTVATNVPRSQNIYSGNLANYGRTGSGGEFQYFNMTNPLTNIAGGLIDPSVTGSNQGADVWTGVTPATGTATATPSTTNLASNILGGTVYVPPTTTGTTGSTTVNPYNNWSYVPPETTKVANGGLISRFANGGLAWSSARNTIPGTEFSYAEGGSSIIPPPSRPRMKGPINGDGHGQEDLIPAQLSDGEYVIDADVVAALGNGSTKAGSAALDQMREAIRKHNRSASHKKIPPKAKKPLEYIKRGRK